MKVTYLGQAGLLFEENGFRIMIDPYLSDSIENVNSKSRRKIPVDKNFFNIKPDIMIFTHNHLDHYDPETVAHFIDADTNVTVLSPSSVWSEVRKIGGNNNYVLFNPHTEWSMGGLTFISVKAEHSDPYAIGVIIHNDKRKYYITGDTLYSTNVIRDLPKDIDYVFLPVNGKGNNMNMTDASRFAAIIGAKTAVPIHVGMFDDISAHDFEFGNKLVLKIYEETNLY